MTITRADIERLRDYSAKLRVLKMGKTVFLNPFEVKAILDRLKSLEKMREAAERSLPAKDIFEPHLGIKLLCEALAACPPMEGGLWRGNG